MGVEVNDRYNFLLNNYMHEITQGYFKVPGDHLIAFYITNVGQIGSPYNFCDINLG